MGTLVAAALSSHAYTFQEPETWAGRRERTRGNYERRYGSPRALAVEVEGESEADNVVRYARIRDGLETVRRRFAELDVDTVVVIGDDQNENFRKNNLPQLCVYTGPGFSARTLEDSALSPFLSDPELAQLIVETGVASDFDVATADAFADDVLISHAHREVISYLSARRAYRALPIFLNAIHTPAPRPARCYAFGQMLRRAIEAAGDRRVAIYASGGMSHFSASFPWPHYSGSATIGSIFSDFDRAAMDAIRSGRGSQLAAFSSDDLLRHGDVEMRQTIALLGALGDTAPAFLTYEPFHKAIMGMAVGLWEFA
jgi:aromatic ring-opening dioxygenase catalytic subunit (LigB family)